MPKNQLGYNKPPEPKFIREMKAKLGYREAQETLQDKIVGDAGAFDDREDRDDEKPTVVVMREGDLTEIEANVEEECIKIIEDEKKVAEGKISFKKPTKREKDDSKDSEEPKKKKEKNSKNKIQKKCLLSFDDEDEDS